MVVVARTVIGTLVYRNSEFAYRVWAATTGRDADPVVGDAKRRAVPSPVDARNAYGYQVIEIDETWTS